MTLYAQRDGEHIIIAHTSGTAEIRIREHVGHVRHFWGELGALVDQADQAEAADTVQATDDTPGGM